MLEYLDFVQSDFPVIKPNCNNLPILRELQHLYPRLLKVTLIQ